MTDNDIAWLAGLAATMFPTAIYVILLVTRDYRPIERRARRFAILASVIASVAIWSVTATVFFLVSELIGNFLMFPSIALTAVAVWHASTITYRKMGGGKESPDSPSGDLNSKELYRLTLPPGEDPIKRGLRADAQKYVRLLKAIQKHTGENLAQLAERLTWATSLHPKQAQGTEESERMANYLQEAINRIDLEFKEVSGGDSLFETFMKTARIKTDMAKQGGRLRWPYYDLDPDYDDIDSSNQGSELAFGPAVMFLPSRFPSDLIPQREDDSEIRYAYWQRDYAYPWLAGKSTDPYPSGVTHHEALMHLPRIYLGVVDWDSWHDVNRVEEDVAQDNGDFIQIKEAPGDRQRKMDILKSHVGELGEIRGPETGHAHIAHRHPKTGEWLQGLSGEYDGEFHSLDESAHMWLVIYPSPDNTTLLPVLYQPMGEGGTVLTLLTQRSLGSLRGMPFVDAGEPRSLYDRIKELMRLSSDRAIYKAWQKTAKDVLDNPLLRAYRRTLAEQDDLERGMAAIWDRK